jgi:hypothetical protein
MAYTRTDIGICRISREGQLTKSCAQVVVTVFRLNLLPISSPKLFIIIHACEDGTSHFGENATKLVDLHAELELAAVV